MVCTTCLRLFVIAVSSSSRFYWSFLFPTRLLIGQFSSHPKFTWSSFISSRRSCNFVSFSTEMFRGFRENRVSPSKRTAYWNWLTRSAHVKRWRDGRGDTERRPGRGRPGKRPLSLETSFEAVFREKLKRVVESPVCIDFLHVADQLLLLYQHSTR